MNTKKNILSLLMKQTLALLVCALILYACGAKKQETETQNEKTEQPSETSQKTEPEVENLNEEIVEEASEEAALDKVSSIMDYFNVWEASINADTKEKMKESMPNMPKTFVEIETKDVANGYIRYRQTMTMGYSEMGYYIAEGGKHFIVNVDFGCGPVCSMIDIRFSELRGGQLIDKTRQYYPESLEEEVEKAVKSKLKGDNSSWSMKVPQKGTSIEVGISSTNDMLEESYIKIGELVFDKKTASFSFKKS